MEQAREWRASQVMLALRELELHRGRIARFFEQYDLLLTPSLAVPAFPVGQWPSTIGERPVADPRWGYTPFTFPFNMTGNCAASIPCGLSSSGLPIGLHIVGRKGAETTVIKASAAFEQARPWAHRRPPIS